MNTRAVQRDFERIGKDGCYFLSIIRAAERLSHSYHDVYLDYVQALTLHYIDETCYVIDPPRLMEMLCGGKWTITKETRNYTAKEGDIVILRFERTNGMEVIAHFVLAGADGSVEYDPYGVSKTVMEGQLVSKRVLRKVG